MPHRPRKYGRMRDSTCKSGNRYTMAAGVAGGGKSKFKCMPKGKCKTRWSNKYGRCKKGKSKGNKALALDD